MTHEFRTPVNAILNLSNFLLDPEDGVKEAEQRIQVSFIQKSAVTLSNFVNDLLDLSKVEAGKIEVRPVNVSLNEILGTVMGLMKPLVQKPDEVNLEFHEVEDIVLFVDDGKLSQILRNLISNALKFTEKGEVRVEASHDSQIDSSLQRQVRGTGLGLPLTLRLTKLLGGRLQVESTPGIGSCFELQAPLRFAGELEGSYVRNRRLETLKNYAPFSNTLSNQVLIIDDDETARYTMIQLLKEFKIDSVYAVNGQSGVSLVKEKLPKLIILDLSMPDLTGFEVIRELMGDRTTCEIPVLICSSLSLTPEEREYLVEVTLGFLPKYRMLEPSEKNEFYDLIMKARLTPHD